ncbi:MAG: helix-turn-helix domain-containing protein [Clostridiales bacterium]|nr:helix-turn-helix domain-containing protein [Clostridiales bacterium]
MRGNETFDDLLKAALNGNEFAMDCVLQQIDPIVRNNSIVNKGFDEDLYQIILMRVIQGIRKFEIRDEN